MTLGATWRITKTALINIAHQFKRHTKKVFSTVLSQYGPRLSLFPPPSPNAVVPHGGLDEPASEWFSKLALESSRASRSPDAVGG